MTVSPGSLTNSLVNLNDGAAIAVLQADVSVLQTDIEILIKNIRELVIINMGNNDTMATDDEANAFGKAIINSGSGKTLTFPTTSDDTAAMDQRVVTSFCNDFTLACETSGGSANLKSGFIYIIDYAPGIGDSVIPISIASNIPFTPTAPLTEDNVEDAINELLQLVEDGSEGRLLRTIIGSGVSYTPSSDCNHILIRLQGGGGQGGGSNTAADSASVGGGGSAGGYLEKYLSVTPSVALTIAIGAGGTGAAAGANGTAGGDTTFNDGTTTYTAKGGLGGVASAASATILSAMGAASPAISINGDVNSGGAPGGFGVVMTGLLAQSGNGGSCLFGAGGLGRNTQGAGNVGVGFGSGGAGACTVNGGAAAAGGDGLVGLIVIEEYT